MMPLVRRLRLAWLRFWLARLECEICDMQIQVQALQRLIEGGRRKRALLRAAVFATECGFSTRKELS